MSKTQKQKIKLSALLEIGVKYINFEEHVHVVFNDGSELVARYEPGYVNDSGTGWPAEWEFYFKSVDGKSYDIADDLFLPNWRKLSSYALMAPRYKSNIQYGE